jgi:hypothetical protein
VPTLQLRMRARVSPPCRFLRPFLSQNMCGGVCAAGDGRRELQECTYACLRLVCNAQIFSVTLRFMTNNFHGYLSIARRYLYIFSEFSNLHISYVLPEMKHLAQLSFHQYFMHPLMNVTYYSARCNKLLMMMNAEC